MMDLDLIKERARRSMGKRHSHAEREPGYAFFHGQRVGKIAGQLRELIYPNREEHDDVILVGGWFHDVGKGIEPHWEYGALIAREILCDVCPEEELNQIVEIVGTHTLRKRKDYPYYVKLVQDADILDHFGSQEIWLNFWHSSYHRETVEHTLAYYRDSYVENAERVRDLLNYPESVAFFDEKDQFVRTFIDRFRREAAGELVR
ncbi:MAG TPA: HD domain-containing protein [Firmicutes bacterium]|jgi:uncharacterized protein|nr:HD domain-containing protein [Bacillota bacterium]